MTLLGAVDSRPFEPSIVPTPGPEPGQGVSEEPREYDYEPGWTFGASATWNRNGQAVLAALYEGRTIYSLDGIRANHVLQRVRADVVLPVRKRMGLGVTGEYFGRFSLYQDPRRSRSAYRYPQFRVFLAVGPLMRTHAWVQRTVLLSMMFVPATTAAQEGVVGSVAPIEPSGSPVLAGAAFAIQHISCQLCEEEFPYRRAASVLGSVGYRLNRRVNVAGEIFWIPTNTASGRVRTLHVDAVGQFRPWSSHGLFVKGGGGVELVRNWIDVPGTSPVTSKALSMAIGAGWEFRAAARVGYQLFAAQHAAALGDIRTTLGDVQNVLGNFWSVGAGVVIR